CQHLELAIEEPQPRFALEAEQPFKPIHCACNPGPSRRRCWRQHIDGELPAPVPARGYPRWGCGTAAQCPGMVRCDGEMRRTTPGTTLGRPLSSSATHGHVVRLCGRRARLGPSLDGGKLVAAANFAVIGRLGLLAVDRPARVTLNW